MQSYDEIDVDGGSGADAAAGAEPPAARCGTVAVAGADASPRCGLAAVHALEAVADEGAGHVENLYRPELVPVPDVNSRSAGRGRGGSSPRC